MVAKLAPCLLKTEVLSASTSSLYITTLLEDEQQKKSGRLSLRQTHDDDGAAYRCCVKVSPAAADRGLAPHPAVRDARGADSKSQALKIRRIFLCLV